MKRLILIVLLCSGCSGVFVNSQSPLRLESQECNLWAPLVDSAVATAAIGTSVAIYESHAVKEPDSSIMLGVVSMYATSFAISAITGYAEYGKCKGKLPLLKEDEDVQDLSQK